MPMLPRALLACLLGCSLSLAAPAQGQPSAIEQAQKLWHQGRQAQALQTLEEALSSQPGEPRLRFNLALMLMEAGRLPQAEAMLTELTQDYPDLPDPFNNLAVLLAGRGELEAARQALQHAISLHPEHAQAQENMGDVLSSLAAQAYERAIKTSLGSTQRLQVKLRRSQAVLRPIEVAGR